MLVWLIASSLAASAGKEKTNTQHRHVASFDKISVSSGIDLYLTQGKGEKVVVEAKPDIIDQIITRVENGVLNIYIEDKMNWNWEWNQSRKAYVTFDKLSELKASAGSDIYSTNAFNLQELKLDVSSGSGICLKEIDAQSVHVRTSSGSDAELSGKTKILIAESSSGSDIKCGDLLAENCEVSSSSGSDAVVHATNSISARASSGSDIIYKGKPVRKNIDESSGGQVKQF